MSLSSRNTSAASNKGRVMMVLDPDDRTPMKTEGGETVTITLLGQDSDVFIAATRAARNKQVENLTERVKFSAAEQDRQTAVTLAACTTGWSNIPKGWLTNEDDDTPLPFSRENAEALYEQPGVAWLRVEVDKFIGTRANFLRTSPTS